MPFSLSKDTAHLSLQRFSLRQSCFNYSNVFCSHSQCMPIWRLVKKWVAQIWQDALSSVWSTVQSFAWSSCSVFAVIVLYKPPERQTLMDLTRNLSIWLLSITTTFVLNSWNEFFKFRACALGYEWINVFPNAYAQSEKLVLVLWRSVLVAKMLYFSFLSVPFLSLSNLLWRLPNASRHIGGNRNLCFCISIYKRWKIFAMKIC